MTAKLEEMISNLDNMSKEDLKALQDQIAERLKENKPATEKPSEDDEKLKSLLRVGYKVSSQDLKKLLFSFLTPEELAKLDTNEIKGELPTLPKTITEYIDEDRL